MHIQSLNINQRFKVMQVVAVGLLIFTILGNILTVAIPPDTTWEYKVDYPRAGKLFTYLYYYDEILGDPHKDAWLDDVADSFDFVYIIAPWGYYMLDNNTLDTKGLINTTRIIKELGDRGCQVVIHTWYSSYHPKFLENYVPELINTSVRWKGLPLDHPHYDILMNVNLQYLRLLIGYLMNQSISNIYGFCLDDETSSGNWIKVCRESTKLIHSFNASWMVSSMFNTDDLYWMASSMDYLAMDPYDDDIGVVSKMRYGHSLSVGKLSVLLSGMGDETEEEANRMRRQGWIAWFMGADSIGWWCYNIYWHGKRGGADNNWYFMAYNSSGPSYDLKGQAVKEFRRDIDMLNELNVKRQEALDTGNSRLASNIDLLMTSAYDYAKMDDFAYAAETLKEALAL